MKPDFKRSRSLNKSPVYVFPTFAKGENDPNVLLERLNFYGSAYCERGYGNTITVLVGLNQDDYDLLRLTDFKFISVLRVTEPTKNFVKFALKSRLKLTRVGSTPKLLISGDIYFGFLTSILLRLLYLPNLLPLQISIHGYYVENISLSVHKFRKLIRGYLIASYRIATSIRVVSPELKTNLVDQLKLPGEKIFVAPIPIVLQPFEALRKRDIDLLFVGRFHEERGLDLLQDIVKSFSLVNLNHKFVFVGNGPLLDGFQTELRKLRLEADFKGFLPNSQLPDVYKSSKIFVSTAPTEGYGLSIREALSYGCILLARKNEVTAALASNFPGLVYLFETAGEAVEQLVSLTSKKVDFTDIENFRRALELSNQDSIEALVASWQH
jgi:glycosyltransferase involved in cell wall biosynthesis